MKRKLTDAELRQRNFEAPFRACANGALAGGLCGVLLIIGLIIWEWSR